jgi:hypothetical protein
VKDLQEIGFFGGGFGNRVRKLDPAEERGIAWKKNMLIKYTVDHWEVDLGLDSSLAVDRFGTSRELNGLHLRGELIQCTSQQKQGLE